MGIDITAEEKLFIEEIARRIPPPSGVIVKTRRGEVVLSQTDKNQLDLIARRERMVGAANLINFYLPN